MTAAPSTSLPRPGDLIAGKYVLDRLLGQGGMGAVFAARHVKLSKPVAIKIMLPDAATTESATRFINEGRAAANIQNEHVVRVDDVDEELGYAYMVLELLEGEDLAQVLEREPTHRLPFQVAVGYVGQALRGVMAAHAIGIVHRDLKPSNLFLCRKRDGSVLIKVLDFGISKAQGSSALAASPNALTSTKAMLGSPLYMSPEQLRSSKNVDHRSDIWAIGVILYELISGQLPFIGDNLGELFANILESDPLPLRQRGLNIPPELDDLILRCLARKPDLRFQSVAELAAVLQPFEVAATPPSVAAYTTAAPSLPFAPPPSASTSGSGARPIQTVALGTTPQGGGPSLPTTTNHGFTNSQPLAVPAGRSKSLPIALGVAGVFLAFGIAGLVLVLKARKPVDPIPASPPPTVTASITPAGTTSAVVATPTPTPTPTPTISTPSAPDPVEAVTAAATAKTTPTLSKTSHAPTVVKVEPKPPEPKPVEPKPVVDTGKKPVTPAPPPTSLQNAR